MFTQRYKHKFTIVQSQLIDAWNSISDKMIEIFGNLGPRRPNEYFKKSFDAMEYELKKQDNLISRVQFMFLYDPISMCTSFAMLVTVNASFIPECVDDICQKYFDKIEDEMTDHFRLPNGHIASDDDINAVIKNMIENYGAVVIGWRYGNGEWMNTIPY